MPSRSTVSRVDPGGSQLWGTLQYDDEIEGTTSVQHELIGQYGSPLSLQCIADAVNTVKEYPDDGTGVAAGVAAGTITTTSVPLTNIDIDGLLVAITAASTGIGQVRRIVSHSGQVMTLNRNWTTTPTGTVNYVLLLDLFKLNQMMLKAEHSNVNETDYLDIVMTLFDVPIVGTRGPRRIQDAPVRLMNLGYSVGVTKAAFSHVQGYSLASRGAVGGKVYLKAISAGTTSLWAGGT